MNVTFMTEIKNRLSLYLRDGHKIVFMKGKFNTTDKEEIKQILNHDQYRKGIIKLVDREDVVGNYLENDAAEEVITEQFLEGISADGIMTLGEFLDVPGKVSKIVKPALIGIPLSTEVQEIANQFRTKTAKGKEVSKL